MDQDSPQTWTDALDGDAAAARDLWTAVGHADALPGGGPVAGGEPVDADAAWARVRAAAADPGARVVPLGKSPLRASRRRRFLGYAAAAVVVAAVLALVNLLAGLGDPSARYANATAEAMPVTLPDDSEAMLMPGSRLRYREQDGRRVVTIAGEVGFAVTRDPGRAFAVDAGELEVVVVGTKFLVNHDNRPGVAVTEGHVRVRGRRDADWTDVYAGGRAAVRDGVVVPPDEGLGAGGPLTFRDAPLPEVLARLSRHYGVTFSAEAGLQTCRFTASLDGASAEEAAGTLALAFGARLERRGGTVHLVGGACE